MDINKYIIDNTAGDKPLDQLKFKMVLGLDTENKHVPKWFKDKRVIALIDYCINEGIVDKNRVFYKFSFKYDPFDIKLINFTVFELGSDQLNQLSQLLPTPDLKEYIKFKVSEPYHAPKFTVVGLPKNIQEINKSKIKTFYDLTCIIDRIETSIGTVIPTNTL